LIRALIHRLRAMSDLDRALARNVALVGVFVGIAGVARLAQEMAVAWRFGTGPAVDAYYFVLTFLNWPVGVWFSVLVAVIVPVEARLRREGSDALMRFRAELYGLTLAASLAVTLLTLAVFGGALHAGVLRVPERVREDAMAALPALAWVVLLGLPIGLLSTWIIAAGRQTNTLLEATPALVVVLVLLAVPEPTFVLLLWGTTAGFVVRLVLLQLVLRSRAEVPRPRFGFSAEAWSTFWKSSAAMVIGQVLLTLTALLDQLFAARLGEGGVATLAYANRIILMVQALTALVAQRASLPLLAESFAAGGEQTHRSVPRWTLAMLLGGTVLAVIGSALAVPVVTLLFERGHFSAADTARVSEVLVYGLVQLPFYLAGLVYVSVLVAQGRQSVLMWAGALGCGVKLAANWLLFPVLGLSGLQLATAAMYLSTLSLLYWASARPARRLMLSD
jgi:peptidoglycan biosynthesis protein MviN/MurJ (putative lipid II flippase)